VLRCPSSFCVGQVKATGKLRVSSTAPYFVDDRLYCPERDMQECKTLDLCVSLVPEQAALSSMEPPAAVEASGQSELLSGSPPRPPADMKPCDGSAVDGPTSTPATTPATKQPSVSANDDVRSTPWALDICLVRAS